MYFFTYESDLPEQVGFSLFGTAHLCWLGGIALGVLLLTVLFLQQPAYRQQKLSRTLALVMCLLVVLEKGILALTGHLTVYSLPLHLCELAPFLYLLFSRWNWDWLGQVIYTLCLPGAVAALVFPDWSVYPMWNFMNLSSFVGHGLLILFPVLQLASGTIRPRLSAIWKPLVFLAVITPPIWLFNRTYGTNYFFLNTASPNSPLTLLLDLVGPTWYLPAYALLAVAVMVVLLLPWGRQREE